MILKVGGDASSSIWGICIETIVSCTSSESDPAKVTRNYVSIIALSSSSGFVWTPATAGFSFVAAFGTGQRPAAGQTQTHTGSDASRCSAVDRVKGNG